MTQCLHADIETQPQKQDPSAEQVTCRSSKGLSAELQSHQLFGGDAPPASGWALTAYHSMQAGQDACKNFETTQNSIILHYSLLLMIVSSF